MSLARALQEVEKAIAYLELAWGEASDDEQNDALVDVTDLLHRMQDVWAVIADAY